MARVIITESLKEQVIRSFKNESIKIFERFKSLETSPHKGDAVSSVEGAVIKELRYGTHRFYFVTDGQVLKFGTDDQLASLLIKFVRMSKKKDQQKTIDEIKDILKSMGFDGF
jgi:hypothetical protein